MENNKHILGEIYRNLSFMFINNSNNVLNESSSIRRLFLKFIGSLVRSSLLLQTLENVII